MFKFNEAISLVVDCESQQEVDALWAKLSAGGSESQCGWLKDKFGLSWQIVPSILPKLLSDPVPAKANRVVQAMLQMKKIDIVRCGRLTTKSSVTLQTLLHPHLHARKEIDDDLR
jgi:predicted 3-demethylubiquinone-9 3-methyltransferase (glyoxalase superfamily)